MLSEGVSALDTPGDGGQAVSLPSCWRWASAGVAERVSLSSTLSFRIGCSWRYAVSCAVQAGAAYPILCPVSTSLRSWQSKYMRPRWHSRGASMAAKAQEVRRSKAP